MRASYDVIIIGGSYAGLSAAMALGRSLRRTLVIDSGKPCNRQTPASHNFITHDGEKPAAIAAAAKAQVQQYSSVQFMNGFALAAKPVGNGFEVNTEDGQTLTARKLIFATGLKDVMPDIPGVAESWGISVIHCPYCHGYEVRQQSTGILANGDAGFEYARLISNWTGDLTIFTNGAATFTEEQRQKINRHQIKIVEAELESVQHSNGQIAHLHLKDGSKHAIKALYYRAKMEQHSDIPAALGCEITEHGLIKTDFMHKTTVPGVYACGDNSSSGRSVSIAVASGNMAGAMANKELIDEDF